MLRFLCNSLRASKLVGVGLSGFLVGCQEPPQQDPEGSDSQAESDKGDKSSPGPKSSSDPSNENSPGGEGSNNDGQSKEPDGAKSQEPEPSTGPKQGDEGPTDPKVGLPGLPPEPGDHPVHGVFSSSRTCEYCHVTDEGVLQSASGESVAPPDLWGSSMMAFSSRDPYWLAQFNHELKSYPSAKDAISDKCTRCHAPALNDIHRKSGEPIAFESITEGKDAIAALGREGVTCTVCHQITDKNFGKQESFRGEFEIGQDRIIWGPHEDPLTGPMKQDVRYTPTASQHILSSEQCATCHTVISNAFDENGKMTGPDFPEQVPYLEWKNSMFPAAKQSCQSCHSPRTGRDGKAFTTVLSIRPGQLKTQREVGDHGFLGANAYMLELLAENRSWAGIYVDKGEMLDSAKKSQALLETSVALNVEGTPSEGEIVVTLKNQVGHKFPTAYPTRRVWIELIAKNSKGKTIFHSGKYNKYGRIVHHKKLEPHYAKIESDKETQIYESVRVNAKGKVTHSLLDSVGWKKDNRILPMGWSDEHEDAKWSRPVGTDKDSDFKAGQDSVRYAIPTSAKEVQVKLWYQSIPPSSIDNFRKHPTPAGKSFSAMVRKTPLIPKLVVEKKLSF